LDFMPTVKFTSSLFKQPILQFHFSKYDLFVYSGVASGLSQEGQNIAERCPLATLEVH